MARHTTPDIAARSGPRGAETDLDRPSWTQSLAGHHRPQSARHIGPTRHSNRRTCRLLRATDSDGTCRSPASTHHGSARPDKAVTSDKNVPGDDPSMGPGATSECQNSRSAGPPARAAQVLHRRRGRIILAATSPQPPGRSNGHPDATSKKDHPPQIASSLAPSTRTSNDERDIGPSLFQPYSLRRSSFVPFPHPSSRRCPLHLVFFRVGVRSPFARALPFYFVSVCVLHSHAAP